MQDFIAGKALNALGFKLKLKEQSRPVRLYMMEHVRMQGLPASAHLIVYCILTLFPGTGHTEQVKLEMYTCFQHNCVNAAQLSPAAVWIELSSGIGCCVGHRDCCTAHVHSRDMGFNGNCANGVKQVLESSVCTP